MRTDAPVETDPDYMRNSPTILACLLLASGLVTAQNPAGKQTEKENWERMKECAAQAEKLNGESSFERFSVQQSHYSPKYVRCFALVLITYPGNTHHAKGWALYDAFEGDSLANIEQDDNGKACGIWEGSSKDDSCPVVRAYIDEHLNH